MPPSLTLIALSFPLLLIAGTLRGITGFGLLLVATPLLFQLFPPKVVIAALIVPAVFVNLTILWRDSVPLNHLRSHLGLFLSGAIGAIVGVVGLVVLESRTIFLIVAGYIVVFLLLQRRGDLAREVATTRGMSVVAGGSGGLLGGTIGLAGPPIVTYLHARPLGKQDFVRVIAVFFLTLLAVRIPSMYAAGLFGAPEVLLGASFTIPAVIGTYLGAGLRPRIPQEVFEIGVEVFLLLMAIKLVIDGLSIQFV